MKSFMRARRSGAIVLATSVVSGLFVLAPASAPAAIVGVPPTPAASHLFSILQDASILELTLDPNTDYTAQVVRNGQVIASATGTTNPNGDATVNGGDGCFEPATPEILPGDIVQTVTAAGTEGMVVQDIKVTQPATEVAGGSGNTVEVRGRSIDVTTGLGAPLSVNEVRVIGGPFPHAINSNRLIAEGDGTFSADPSTPGGWIATFGGLTTQDAQRATAADSEARFITGPNANEVTIVTFGTLGPVPDVGCPAVARNAVTSATPTLISTANSPTAVTVQGVAQSDVTAVSVRLVDSANHATSFVPATMTAGFGSPTFTATVPASALAGLVDGPIRAEASYTIPTGTITGATVSITKDTVAPAAPTATPGSGQYAGTQNVALVREAGAVVHFTTDGSAPSLSSPTLASNATLPVADSQTIRAFAVDAAGNTSPESTFTFVIGPAPTPVVSISPSSMTFPGTAVSTASAPQTVTVTNAGTGDLLISAIGFSGTNPGDFSVANDLCTAATVVGGATCTFDIVMTPAAAGNRAANVAITHNASGTPWALGVAGTGFVPTGALTLGSSALTFADTAVGAVSAPGALTLTNTGTAPLTIIGFALTGANPGDFQVTSDTCSGIALAVSASCTVGPQFAPATGGTGGARSATLVVSDTTPASPHDVLLSANALAPIATLSGPVSFADTLLGSTSAPVLATVTNTGTAPMTIASVTLGGLNAGDFAITADTCTNTTVNAGASCSVTSTFTPTVAGARAGALSIADSAGGPHTIDLAGVGTTPTPIATLSPSTVQYDPTAIGTPAAQVVTITNTGTAPLAITSIATSGGQASDFAIGSDSCTNASVPVGGSCAVAVVFTPAAVGDRLANLVVTADTVTTAVLHGRGAAPVSAASGTDAGGYRMLAADGGIFSFGNAPFFGSTGAMHLNQPIVGMAARTSSEGASGNGYWLVARDGGIFSFGDAAFFGSTGAIHLNQPIVGMAATPSGNGYWLVARDGGIFGFGDAAFFGSTGSRRLNQPIIGMVATRSGLGYWLYAADGGLFGFGDAAFLGSPGGTHLNQPIVGMARTASGNGYWMVARDGGLFGFGDAPFFGSMGGTHLNQPIVGISQAGGAGYRMVARDGGLFGFGNAPFLGSMGGTHLNQPIIALS